MPRNPFDVIAGEMWTGKLTPGLTRTPGPTQPGAETSRFIWPAVGQVSQGYSSAHRALDIAGFTGTPVQAADDGRVVLPGEDTEYGLHILLDHGGGFVSFYSHLSVAYVRTGETVQTVQEIGLLDSTGLSTGPHLHYEIRQDGEPISPSEVLPGTGK